MSTFIRRGRRPMFDEPARAAIRIRVTRSQRIELEQVARENNTDVAGAIREAVNCFVSDYRENRPVFRGPQIKT